MITLSVALVTLLVGLALGHRTGVYRGQRRVRKTTDPVLGYPELQRRLPAVPVCGCGHSLSFHSPTETHRPCQHRERGRYRTYESTTLHNFLGGWTDDTKCSCVHYIGPEPLPEFMALEV